MKIRKFVAPSVPQALRLVRDDLGDQAVILNTRQMSGAKGSQQVEITAALDAPASSSSPAVSTAAPGQRRGDLLGRTYNRSTPASAALPDTPAPSPRWEAPAAHALARGRQRLDVSPASTSSAAAWLARLPSVSKPDPTGPAAEGADAGATSAGTGPPAPAGGSRGVAPPVAPPAEERAPMLRRLRHIEDAVRQMARHAGGLELPPEVARLGERLRRVGVNEPIIRSLLPKVLRRLGEAELDDREAVGAAAAAELQSLLPERADLRIGRQRKVVAFVGPSGSGKTTAVAKVATGFVRRRQRHGGYVEGEIVIISTDTQRVGALAQARAYADLIGVPLADAHDADELGQVLRRHEKARLVLIDTAGIAPHQVRPREQLRCLLEAAAVDEVQVVVDGRTSCEHILDVLETLDGVEPRRLLLSKMDEALHPGPILSAVLATTMPSSFFTTGPGIPGGIAPGDLRRIVDWVVGRCRSPFAAAAAAGGAAD